MARFNFNSIALNTRADASKINENFNSIETNAVLKTDKATTSADGLMSKEDKVKLNGIATEANKTVVDSSLSSSSTNPVQNKVINTALGNKVDKVSGKGLSTNDYTTNEKNKLAGIAAGATNVVVDTAINAESANPVRNSVITTELNKKVDKVNGKGLSTNDYTTADKNKLAGIDDGANYVDVDSSLSSTSENPVQNKVVKSGLDGKVSKAGDTMTGNLTTTGIVVGSKNGALGTNSGMVGNNNKVTGNYSFAAGQNNVVTADNAVALGTSLTISDTFGVAVGMFNISKSHPANTFIVGGGGAGITSNAFRVISSGSVYCNGSYNTTGADYAETTEWLDGNPNDEDRVGKFVCMQGTKMRIANANDIRNRIGVVSSTPAVIGDSYCDEWRGKYVTDIFGRKITHIVHYERQLDENGNVIMPECDRVEPILSENYDDDQEYIEREKRKEFGYFGMLGKLIVIDDGTCEVDGYCYPNNNGIATKENDINKGFYVMERLDETHVRILLK